MVIEHIIEAAMKVFKEKMTEVFEHQAEAALSMDSAQAVTQGIQQALAVAGQAAFRTWLELPNGIPSHDTFGNVFAALDPQALQTAFIQWAQEIA